MSATAETSGAVVRVFKPESVIGGWWLNTLRKIPTAIYRWAHAHAGALLAGRATRRLTMAETLSLGDKRFVSIVSVDGEQFLLGGSSSNIVLLAKLESAKTSRSSGSFSQVMSHTGIEEDQGINSLLREFGGGDL